MAPFSQPSVHASGFHGRTLEGVRVGMDATENAYITIYHISMRLRIEVLIDLKLEKLAPFSQLSAHVSGFHRSCSGRRSGVGRLGLTPLKTPIIIPPILPLKICTQLCSVFLMSIMLRGCLPYMCDIFKDTTYHQDLHGISSYKPMRLTDWHWLLAWVSYLSEAWEAVFGMNITKAE